MLVRKRIPVPPFSAWLSALLLTGFFNSACDAADRIVLRNLRIMADRRVTAFDEDGVRLDDQRIVPWDEIERATIAPEKQAAFDKMVRDLGEPLFRVRQRIKVGDYEGALPPAESLFPRYAGRRSATAYLVAQALMWGRVSAGEREAAVEPYFYCYDWLRGKKKEDITLPGDRRLKFDEPSGFCPELLPIWFDSIAARKALPAVLKGVTAMREPRPEAVRIYYSTLALAAGESEIASKSMRGFSSQLPIIAELRHVVEAEQEIRATAQGATTKLGEATRRLQTELEGLSSATRPLALYWLGHAKIAVKVEDTQREGLLHLLHLPALYGSAYPEIAAAALYESMETLEKLNDTPGSIALRKELLMRFGQTLHARKLREAPQSPK